jgi:hypothetical protein
LAACRSRSLAGESGVEAVNPCRLALIGLAGSLERLAASPLLVGWPRRPRLRELPLAYIRDPRALASELVALISNHLTLVGHPVSFVRATRSLSREPRSRSTLAASGATASGSRLPSVIPQR